MTTLAWFDTVLFTRLVLTFGHFLWQGAAITLSVLVLSVVLRNSTARLRYVLFLAALMLMAICPVVTFWFVQAAESGPLLDEIADVKMPPGGTDTPASAPDEIAVADTEVRRMRESSTEQPTSEALADTYVSNGEAHTGSRWQWVVPYLTVVYLLGVMLLLGRLLLGLHGGHHLRRQSQLIDEPELLSGIARSAKALGMRFAPTVLYCKQVAVPTVVGVFRPAILLPLSLTTGLSPDQVEAVLTHELAHVRRYDHLVNILQRVIESLLFFHPAVWWVSHRIRVERENCCDDIVVALGSEPVSYAACLLDIAERGRARRPSPQLETVAALHATKSGSQLGHRVRRLVSGASSETLRLSRGGHVLTLVCLALVAFGGVLLQGQTESDARNNETQEKDEPKNTDGKATKDGRNGPRAVVAKWLDLVRADNIRDSWVLTTKSVDLDAQDALKRLWNKDKVRIERSLGNDSAAVVVTNTVKDNSGRDRAFAFWLMRRNGMWLINVSFVNDPEDIELQLRGFFIGGNVHWHVTTEDIVGAWIAGPGFAVPIQYQFESNGTYSWQTRNSSGKLTEKRGTWRLEKDLLIRELDERRTVSRVVWLQKDLFQLEASDGKSRTGYRREKIAKKQSSNTRSDTSTPRRPKSSDRDAGGEVKKGDLPGNAQSAPAIGASNTTNATKTVYIPDVSKSRNVLLDLTSGAMLSDPSEVPGENELTVARRIDNGYLFYKGDLLGLLDDAKAMIWNKDRFVPLKSAEQLGKLTAYKLPKVPCRLLVTTAVGKQFDVTFLSETKDGGIVLEYRAVAKSPAKSTAIDADHKRLRGVWKVLSVEENGHAKPEIDRQLILQSGSFQMLEEGKKEHAGFYTIDPSQNPKIIYFRDATRPFPLMRAIYDVPGEGRLNICYSKVQNKRPTSFDTERDSDDHLVMEYRLETKDAAPAPKNSDRETGSQSKAGVLPSKTQPTDTAGAANRAKATKTVYVPAVKSEGKNVILELASGDMLPSQPANGGLELRRLGNGYLFYKGEQLGLLEGAKAMIWNKDRFVPLKSAGQMGKITAYKLPSVPCRLLVTTATKRQFDVTILSETKDGGIVLEYRANSTETPTGAAATVTDHERLQAVWKLLSTKENGRDLPELDGHFVLQSGRYQIIDDGKQEEFGTYSIDPIRNPKTIDLHRMSKRKRRVSWGIYDFPREGRLRICFGYNRTGHPPARPTNFDSVRGIRYLRVLEFQLETRDASAAPTSADPNATTPAKTDKAATKTAAGSVETVTDQERLQGAWKVVGGKKKGRAPPEVGAQFVFQSGRFQIHDDDLDGTKELFGTYTIDCSRSPKTIDLQFVSSRELPMLPAIYEFPGEGGLRICFGPDKTGRPTRPTSFDSKQGIGNLTVLELRLEAKAVPKNSAATVTDHKGLQAAWKVLSVKKNGDALPDIDGKYVFHANRFQIFDNGEEAVSGTYTIDKSRNPKIIDLHCVGQPDFPTMRGIYDFPSAGSKRGLF